jgi:hypothetical protein
MQTCGAIPRVVSDSCPIVISATSAMGRLPSLSDAALAAGVAGGLVKVGLTGRA